MLAIPQAFSAAHYSDHGAWRGVNHFTILAVHKKNSIADKIMSFNIRILGY
jgi:hypothetical protein